MEGSRVRRFIISKATRTERRFPPSLGIRENFQISRMKREKVNWLDPQSTNFQLTWRLPVHARKCFQFDDILFFRFVHCSLLRIVRSSIGNSGRALSQHSIQTTTSCTKKLRKNPRINIIENQLLNSIEFYPTDMKYPSSAASWMWSSNVLAAAVSKQIWIRAGEERVFVNKIYSKKRKQKYSVD